MSLAMQRALRRNCHQRKASSRIVNLRHQKGLRLRRRLLAATPMERSMTKLYLLFGIILLFSNGEPAWAQSETGGVPWDQLSQDEQQVLRPLQDQWDHLPPSRQERLRKGAKRWESLSAEQREKLKERFQRWKELPPERQERIRKRFERFRNLTPEQRHALRQKRQWFRNLPPERRQELRRQWENLPPERRRDFMRELGPARRHHENGPRPPHSSRP